MEFLANYWIILTAIVISATLTILLFQTKEGEDRVRWYWPFSISVVIIITLGLFLGIPIPDQENTTSEESSTINWRMILIIWWLVYILYSTARMKVDGAKDVGVLQFLGWRIGSIDQGIVPGFWGLTTLQRDPRGLIQRQVPGEDSDIWRKKVNPGGETETLPTEPKRFDRDSNGIETPVYWVPPMFLLFEPVDPQPGADLLEQLYAGESFGFIPEPTGGGEAKKDDIADEYRDPVKTRVSVEISASYTMQITQAMRFDVAFDSIDGATRQVQDLVIGGIRSACQTGTVARAKRNVDAIGKYVTRHVLEALAENKIDYHEPSGKSEDPKTMPTGELRKLVENEIGLRFVQVKNVQILLSHSFSKSIQKIGDSIGESIDGERKGQVAARNKLRDKKAEADGAKAMKAALEVSGQDTLVMDALKEGMRNPNAVHIFGDGGIPAVVTQAQAVLGKVKPSSEESPQSTVKPRK